MIGEGPKYSDTNSPREYTPIEKEGNRIYRLELNDFLNELIRNAAEHADEYNMDMDYKQLITMYKNKLAAHGILI
jgi:hypothetical protein